MKAVRVLGECDVVLYDRLVNTAILMHARPEAELLYVGKMQGEQGSVQDRIFELIVENAQAGKVVGRLKGGDPFIFGRGGEEWGLAVDHGIEVEFVPGISSAVGVPGLAGIPLTHRQISQGFAVVTGHLDEIDSELWTRYSDVETIVVLMGVKNRQLIARSLLRIGRPVNEPVAFIQNGSLTNEIVVVSTLGQVAAGQVAVTSPAVFVIGQVVELRSRLDLTSRSPKAREYKDQEQ